MIPFSCRLRDHTRTPILRSEEIRQYAEAVVGDYKPSLLREPGSVNVPHFLESYLGATLDYQYIYYERGSDPIAGATVFNDSLIRVFDREGKCIRAIPVTAGTIIIDNDTADSRNKGFALFTGLHEGGHFVMHGDVYRRTPNQISLYEPAEDGEAVVCCRRKALFSYRSPRNLSPEEHREHQANVFAAFVAMPRQTFVPLADSLIRNEGFSDHVFPEDGGDWENYAALERICNKLSEVYGVSPTAAKVHLKEVGMLMNIHAYEEQKAQTIFM